MGLAVGAGNKLCNMMTRLPRSLRMTRDLFISSTTNLPPGTENQKRYIVLWLEPLQTHHKSSLVCTTISNIIL